MQIHQPLIENELLAKAIKHFSGIYNLWIFRDFWTRRLDCCLKLSFKRQMCLGKQTETN